MSFRGGGRPSRPRNGTRVSSALQADSLPSESPSKPTFSGLNVIIPGERDTLFQKAGSIGRNHPIHFSLCFPHPLTEFQHPFRSP